MRTWLFIDGRSHNKVDKVLGMMNLVNLRNLLSCDRRDPGEKA